MDYSESPKPYLLNQNQVVGNPLESVKAMGSSVNHLHGVRWSDLIIDLGLYLVETSAPLGSVLRALLTYMGALPSISQLLLRVSIRCMHDLSIVLSDCGLSSARLVGLYTFSLVRLQ